MQWPDIFYKTRKPSEPDSAAKPVPPDLPAIKSPPADATPSKPLASATTPPPLTGTPVVTPEHPERSTRTIPVTHGVVLRPPTGRVTQLPMGVKPPELRPPEPMKNIEQLMTEADPVKTLRQTGNVHLLRRLASDPGAPSIIIPPSTATTLAPSAAVPPIRADGFVASAPLPPAAPPPMQLKPIGSPWPSFQPKATPPPMEVKQVENLPPLEVRRAETPSNLAATVPLRPVVTPLKVADTPSARTTVSLTSPPRPVTGGLPPMIPIGTVIRRQTKMADVARLVLPPKREDSGPLPPMTEPAATSSSTVVPPSFPVSGTTTKLVPPIPRLQVPRIILTEPESPFMDRAPKTEEDEPFLMTKPPVVEAPKPAEVKPAEPAPIISGEPKVDPQAHKPEPSVELPPKLDPEAHKPAPEPAKPETPKPVPVVVPEKSAPVMEVMPKVEPAPAPVLEATPAFESVPHVDPLAHKPTPTTQVLPKLDPEAHKAPLPATTSTELGPVQEPREFHLTNGEKVAGVVLRETADMVYVQHATLGILTIPRGEIAKRLVEIILINGDRLVGDIMAETADMLYVRHASLGMISVPRAQRSTRVVEAILKSGDRILGEVLTETDTFTVIKSATLGTVTVPHDQVTMLNRKAEQIELKALPMTPALPPG